MIECMAIPPQSSTVATPLENVNMESVEDAIYIHDSPPITPPPERQNEAMFIHHSPPVAPTLEKQDEAILIHDSPPMAPPLVYMKDKLDDAVSIHNSTSLSSTKQQLQYHGRCVIHSDDQVSLIWLFFTFTLRKH